MNEVVFSQELSAWLTQAGLAGTPETDIVSGCCDRCVAAGIPLGRAHVFIDTLHPVHEGRLFRWGYGPDEAPVHEYGRTSLEGRDAFGPVSLDAQATDVWRRSPFYNMLQTGASLLRRRLDANNKDELVRARSAIDNRFERPGYDPYPQRDLRFGTLCLSRPLLEFSARRRIGQESNISIRPRCRVTALVSSPNRDCVSAVRYDDAEGSADIVEANLVVDASGRAALTLAFLESIGTAKPNETEIGIDQAYSTAIFEIPDDAIHPGG